MFIVTLHNYAKDETFKKSQHCWECKNESQCGDNNPKNCKMLQEICTAFGTENLPYENTGYGMYIINFTIKPRRFNTAIRMTRQIMESYRQKTI